MGIFEMFAKAKTDKKEKIRSGLLSRRHELEFLEDQENQNFNKPLIKDMDSAMQKTYQSVPMMTEDSFYYSQGVVSPKQGIYTLVEDIIEMKSYDSLLEKEEKKAKENVANNKLEK